MIMRKIINIAHRGYHRDFPENTLEAFEAAVLLGVDGIEFDVHETADGGFFVFHDDYLAGRDLSKMTADEIRSERIAKEYSIPSLEDVLEICSGEMILLIELKQVRSLEKLLDILRTAVEIKMVVIMSFNGQLIKSLGLIAPDIMSAVIGSNKPASVEVDGDKDITGVVSMRPYELTTGGITAVHNAGGLVFAWDCKDAESVHYALEFEIDGIISDFPDIVIEKAMHEN